MSFHRSNDCPGEYLVLAERHHASVGCIRSSKDVWRVVGPLHTVVQLRELREGMCIHKEQYFQF